MCCEWSICSDCARAIFLELEQKEMHCSSACIICRLPRFSRCLSEYKRPSVIDFPHYH
jgi:hypothetical protein